MGKESLWHLPREIFPLAVPEQVLKKRPLGEGRKAAITESGFPINPHSKRLSHITYDFHPDQGMCLPSTKKDAKKCLLLGRFVSPEEDRVVLRKKVDHQFATYSERIFSLIFIQRIFQR
ncbi:uncharacterized protein TNIN_255001 [Trichonephila inaurata madagascariensis]|uniref:Uncharacterized protein n=1 Tax=Trichonephila inaurata madagascariensis TaxID=2747483 RepID=A0A8X6WQB1_9ARAC|nr:uncharacterized protein TNIN_255001 [Trichonephila inaurata madagascariensis]